jgi:hypothetical protein
MVRSFLAVVLCAAALLANGHGQETKVAGLMQQKLAAAQKVLEGVALNDFGKITQNAQDLIRISKLAEWRIVKTPQYELHSNEFRRNAETLLTRAREKNLDGAALAYVELTLSCVRCHKYVREVRTARLDSGVIGNKQSPDRTIGGLSHELLRHQQHSGVLKLPNERVSERRPHRSINDAVIE